ncbi:MAG: SDR family oxidoreductase [Anaerolineales bacterium]|nr:SDR family oxidoreductase [Anaerolineales bacterium]
MQIAVFGATGGTGQQVVQQALAAGHSVSALVRDPSRLAAQDERLTVVEGDVLDRAKVDETVSGADAVIVSLGNTSNNPDYIVSRGTEVIVDSMTAAGKPMRLIVVSSLGVGESRDQVPFAFKMLMNTVLKKAMDDKERQEALVKASGFDWIIVRPGGLTNGPATGSYKAGVDVKLTAGQVSRADVAAFVLLQLDDDTYLHQAPAITG